MRRPLGISRHLNYIGVFALLLTAAIPVFAEEKPASSGQPVRYTSRQTLDKQVTLARLSNGMTVLVQENHGAPIATVRCYVGNTGSVYEGKYLGAGISHLLEHLVAGGSTTNRDEAEIQAIVDTLGGQTNAYTSTDITTYYIDCPSKGVNIAIELIADSMQNAAIKPDEFEREMGVVTRELEMGESERSRMLYQVMSRTIFTEHPMRHPIIGYLPVLQNIGRDDVYAFYRDRYVPQNMTFVVVGDVDTQAVLDEVRKRFENFTRTAERSVVLPIEPDQASPRSDRIEMEGTTTQLAMGWPTVPLQHPDLYPLDVASYILTNGDSSRLVKRLKIDQPLALDVSSSSYTPGYVSGWFQISAEAEPENVEAVRTILDEEITRLRDELVDAQTLARAKRQKAADQVFVNLTVQQQAEMLAGSFRATGDPLFDDRYVEQIQKVTAEEVREVARRYFVPHRLNTVRIDPIGTQQSATTAAGRPTETPIVKKELSNGLVLLLKRQSQAPMVTIQAFLKAGVTADTTQDSGLASLASELMPKGTKKYTAAQIAEYFDSIGGSFGMQSARNTSYLQCAVLSEDLEKSLDYVDQVLFAPTFPEEEFTKAKQLRLAAIEARSANPQAEIMDFWSTLLPSSTPFSRTVGGTLESVGRLTVADCQRFHRQYVVPNNLVLAVFGDFDPDTVAPKLEAIFGGYPRDQKFQWPKFPDSHTTDQDLRKHLTNQKANTAMVMLGYPTVSIYDEATRSALEVLSGILTGGSGAGGRLHNELRGQQLVYYVFGFEISGFAPGYYCFLAQTRPETVDEVVDRIQANLRRIADEGVEEDELNKVKQKLITAQALRNTTPTEQAFSAALDELYGLGYQYADGYEARIDAVTGKQIAEVVKKYFGHYILATSSPATDSAAASNKGK